jgi:dihydrolipoamide dehydrogenase
MLVLGGGYIGLELGQVYASLGASVSVVEMMPSLLPGVDPDLVKVLARKIDSQFDQVMLKTKVTGAEEKDDGIAVDFQADDGTTFSNTFDKVLVAVGRKPLSENLGLENTNVQIDKDGFVKVDAQRRTHEPTILAIGDVAGQPMLAHKATHEGRVAAEAVHGEKAVYEPRAIPAVVFTDPEIAWCGLSEDEARRQGMNVDTGVFPWEASGRAATMDHSHGVTKIVADSETGQVLGMGIAGHNAGELIGEGVLAVEMGAVAEDIALCIHAHPSLSETIMEAAENLLGQSTHFFQRM